jgi:hypothetical protein
MLSAGGWKHGRRCAARPGAVRGTSADGIWVKVRDDDRVWEMTAAVDAPKQDMSTPPRLTGRPIATPNAQRGGSGGTCRAGCAGAARLRCPSLLCPAVRCGESTLRHRISNRKRYPVPRMGKGTPATGERPGRESRRGRRRISLESAATLPGALGLIWMGSWFKLDRKLQKFSDDIERTGQSSEISQRGRALPPCAREESVTFGDDRPAPPRSVPAYRSPPSPLSRLAGSARRVRHNGTAAADRSAGTPRCVLCSVQRRAGSSMPSGPPSPHCRCAAAHRGVRRAFTRAETSGPKAP